MPSDNSQPDSSQPDLVIRGALLIDGSGKPGVRGDLAIKDDRIVSMGDLSQTKGAREIAANGLALAPGFIDTHTHDDRALLSDPLMECKISQGVTTVIVGNCGISLAPLVHDDVPPPLNLLGGPGTITQANRQVGAIGLFNIDARANLRRFENSGVIPDQPATPVLDFSRTGMQQGYVENANVNAVMEMSRLISITRTFEMVSASLAASEASLQEAIKQLGSTG